jgi:chorismate synthase
MKTRINEVIRNKDTLGGVIEIVAINVPPGLGSYVHWDRRLESRLGAAILSVQAIKGVEIGYAFENSRKPGTQVNDSIYLENDILYRKSNNAGGIEGGISNGNPILIRAAMKPIATTLTPLESVDLSTGRNVSTKYERSDFCPVPRAVPILEAMVAYIIANALIEKIGGDSIQEMLPRFNSLKSLSINDLKMDGLSHTYWPINDE